MTEQLETVPKEEKAERELRRSSLDKHKKEKPFKTGRGRISTPERKIAKKEPSTLSRDEVRRKKGSFNTPITILFYFLTVLQYYLVTLLYVMCTITLLTVVVFNEISYNYVRSHVQGSLLHWSYFIVDIPTDHWVMHLNQCTSAPPLPA